MKISKNYSLLSAVMIFTVALISWDSNNSKTELNTPLWSYSHEKDNQGFTEAEMSSYMADDDWQFTPGSNERFPTAEDVLIQKIPGDKNHLLMMAFYSKENYSRQFVTLNSCGLRLVFRDDGKDDVKKD